jgi:hypothetical protein
MQHEVPDYNKDDPPSLLAHGLLQGKAIEIETSTLNALPGTSGRISTVHFVASKRQLRIRRGEPGLVAVKTLDDSNFRLPRNARRETSILSSVLDCDNVRPRQSYCALCY